MNETALPLDERQQKGLVIAATLPIKANGGGAYVVPSQSSATKYRVDGNAKTCSCPDFELRQKPCKHVFAVEFVQRRETTVRPNGDVTVVETTGVRVTYGQNWSAYNHAQTTEKDHFCRLLHDLVADVPTPPQTGSGNRRVAMSDLLFGAAFKVYTGFSARRFMSDLRAARDSGHVTSAASYNAILDGMQMEAITPILHELITATAKPLAAVETQFAVDSTGFGTQCFYRHYTAKYGREQVNRDYVKLHALIGTKTNVIAACTVTDRDAHDCPQFKPLIEAGAESFAMTEISADKAYSSYDNLQLVEAIGGTPYIPFKSTARAAGHSNSHKPTATWTRLYHYFQLNRDDFLEHYHRRSNAESVFSMLKRCVGDTLRSKTRIAQINETLLMVLCHNIRVLVHEMHELGINPSLRLSGGQPLVG